VLAAGGGRRLGGHPKALLEYRGRPLVERAVRALREGGCQEVTVVLGAAAAQVRAQARLTGCTLVDNPDWQQGMGTSLHTGLAALTGGDAAAAVVMLVDQPRIGADVVARVRGAYEAGAELVAASYGGERGHPVLFARGHWAEISATAAGDRGARDFLRAHRDGLTLVECADIAAPDDIDTPDDLDLLDE